MLRETDGVHGKRLAGGRFRPGRAEVDPAAYELVARFGPEVLSQARRYSLTAEDAEDAYQRGLEILLTKAPTTEPAQLVPWLKTVVKREALALRRHHEHGTREDPAEIEPPPAIAAHESAERMERLRVGAEALRHLKPQEVRCLLLKAEGYSYAQIQETTRFSYTKVDRCLKEGRRAFTARVAGIEAGDECERLSGALSRFADGEASSEDMTALRPHLRTCLQCRGRLREYRAAPARVAALVPAGVVAVQPGGGATGRMLEGVAERLAALGERAHGMAEMVSGGKLAAVAASTVAIAGGGTAVVEHESRERDRASTHVAHRAQLAADEAPVETGAQAPATAAPTHDQPAAPTPQADSGTVGEKRETPAAKPEPEPEPAPTAPAPAAEFESAAPAARAPAASAPAPARSSPSSGGGGSGSGSEFGGP